MVHYRGREGYAPSWQEHVGTKVGLSRKPSLRGYLTRSLVDASLALTASAGVMIKAGMFLITGLDRKSGTVTRRVSEEMLQVNTRSSLTRFEVALAWFSPQIVTRRVSEEA